MACVGIDVIEAGQRGGKTRAGKLLLVRNLPQTRETSLQIKIGEWYGPYLRRTLLQILI
jgi:hypothetical protein